MIKAVDLFAGAGGCSTGLLTAATHRGHRVDLVAVNHWPIAVQTHTVNHPEARHFCASVETLDPRIAVPGGKLDLLIAAPECVFHSTARGGKPIDDQRRASAWHILRWLELLRVEEVLIENVPEFVKWGPLGATDRPLKSKAGDIFRAFIAAIEALNYRVEWKILNAADYGAPTTRRRFFLRARRGGKRIAWPAPTHSKTGSPTLFSGPKKWRAAREVIDWTLPSQSIFQRARPLKPATMRRIIEGLRRFGGPQLEPFLVLLRNNATGQSLDTPLSTMTASGGHHGLVEPVLVQLTHGGRVMSVNSPLPTVTTANRVEMGVAQPFLVPYHAERDGQTARTHDVEAPLPVVPTSPVFGLVELFIFANRSNNAPKRVDEPVPPLCTGNHIAVVEAFVLQQQSGGVARPVSEPAPTLAAKGAVSLVEPFLTKYNRTAVKGYSVEEPLDTVSTRDRVALVQPVIDGYALDIRFRMLQPAELAGAMSFPRSYIFTGNKGDQIRQIGNAVCCTMAEALCGAILDGRQAESRERKAGAA